MDSVNYYIIFSFTTYSNWLLGWLIVCLDKLISWCGNAIHVINLCQLMVLSWCFCHIQIWTRSRKILKCVYGWLTGGGRLSKIQRYTRYSMVTMNIGGNKDTRCVSLSCSTRLMWPLQVGKVVVHSVVILFLYKYITHYINGM